MPPGGCGGVGLDTPQREEDEPFDQAMRFYRNAAVHCGGAAGVCGTLDTAAPRSQQARPRRLRTIAELEGELPEKGASRCRPGRRQPAQVKGQVVPEHERVPAEYPAVEQAYKLLAGQAGAFVLRRIALDEGNLLAGEGVGVVEDACLMQPVQRGAGKTHRAVALDALLAVEAMHFVAAEAEAL